MTADQVARALEPFRQVDSSIANRNEGTALGRPLGRTLIELRGGSLAIESEPQVRTTVTLILPGKRLVGSA